MDFLPEWVERALPIFGLIAVIAFIIRRLPKIDLGHSEAFLRRRVLNWLPLGLTYAFLYMGRYNINAAKNAGLMTNEELGLITFWGTLTYGCSFLINGPLADKFGGRKTILAAACGSALMNLGMGLLVISGYTGESTVAFSAMYAANMYFQSFGAVSIVKVNASWFHVRERGVFGGIFGILISLGIYFAFDWGGIIAEKLPVQWVFWIPTILLAIFLVIDYFLVFDTPADTGHDDFDTLDASSGDTGERLPVTEIAKRMLANPVIRVIALVELCSGFVRGGIMKWTYVFLKETGPESFVYKNWGLLICCAGILGGVFAGAVSDRMFQSRRGPSATILFGSIVVSTSLAAAFIQVPQVAYILVFSMLCIIGVHGMLSGTASMDFGGRKNVGVAVGMIDGMVYLGYAAQSLLFGYILPQGAAQAEASNWRPWLVWIVPVGLAGFLMCTRIWNATPIKKKASA